MSKKKDEELINTAKERFKLAAEHDSDNRERQLDDLRFLALEQWPEELRRAREGDPDGARPCLVVDKVNQYINQVLNNQREARPSPKVRPVDDNADVETAEILQGVVRNIMDKSSADIAIDTAYEHAVKAGAGYFRVLTDYAEPLSFDQEILVKRVRNPFSVYLDPFGMEPDGSDNQWGFVVEELSKEEFEEQYPKAEPVNWEQATSGDLGQGWLTKDTVRVAEYFYMEPKEVEIVRLSNGVTVKAEVFEKMPELASKDVTIIDQRKATVNEVKWCKINGEEILERSGWAGSYIPIIPVYGEELELDGKIIRTGLTYKAKDAQRAYNYAASAFIERVALVPKSPYIAAAGQIENYEDEWAEANTSNIPTLRYDPISVDGVAVPPPQRQAATDIPQGWLSVMQTSEHDVQASLGMYNTAIGEQSNELSGRAILSKQKKSDVANLHFADNLGRSIRHLGRIIVELIPKIYDTKRVIRIIGEDDEVQNVRFDPNQQQAVAEMRGAEGQEVSKIYNPTVGKYDVSVSVSASYATKRQEAAEAILSLTQSYPALMQIGGDIMVKNMDWPGAQELGERLKKSVPPQLLDEGEEQIPPQVQQVMQQSADMIEQLQGQVGFLTQQLTDEGAKIKVDQDKNLISAEGNEIKQYEAETKRMKEAQPVMSPEQIQVMIAETIQGLSTTPDISQPEGSAKEPLDFSGL